MAKTTNTPGTSDLTTTVDSGSEAPETERTDAARTEAPEETPKMAELKGVKFHGAMGLAGVTRTISVADFKAVGVDTSKDLIWSKDNDFTVPVSDLNAAVRDYLAADADFELVTE